MKHLLDTHAAVWLVSDPDKLSAPAGRVAFDPGAQLLLSVVSVWELVIKSMLGKLDLADPVPDVVIELLKRGNVTVLPVTLEHALRVLTLPPHHKDPFDRMLVAQALVEDAVLLTIDPDIRQYPAAPTGNPHARSHRRPRRDRPRWPTPRRARPARRRRDARRRDRARAAARLVR